MVGHLPRIGKIQRVIGGRGFADVVQDRADAEIRRLLAVGIAAIEPEAAVFQRQHQVNFLDGIPHVARRKGSARSKQGIQLRLGVHREIAVVAVIFVIIDIAGDAERAKFFAKKQIRLFRLERSRACGDLNAVRILGGFRDDVDHRRKRIRPVQGRTRPANHFHLLNVIHRNRQI